MLHQQHCTVQNLYVNDEYVHRWRVRLAETGHLHKRLTFCTERLAFSRGSQIWKPYEKLHSSSVSYTLHHSVFLFNRLKLSFSLPILLFSGAEKFQSHFILFD